MTIAPDSSSSQPSCAGSRLGVKLGTKKSPLRDAAGPAQLTARPVNARMARERSEMFVESSLDGPRLAASGPDLSLSPQEMA
jgi:hypothetical protein